VAADYTWASLARDVLTIHAFDKFPGCTPAIWQAGDLQNYLGCIPFSYEGGNYWLWSDTHPYELGDVRDPSQYPNAFDITQPQYCDLYADMQEFVPHVYAQRRPDTGRKIKFEHGVLLPPEYYGELLLELTYPSGGSFGVEVEFLPQYIGMPQQLLRLPDGTKINVAKAKVYCSTPTYKRFLWHFERGQDGQWHPYIDENVNSETFYVPVTLKFMGVIRRPLTTENTLINWKYMFVPLPFSWSINNTSCVIDITEMLQWLLDNRGRVGYLGYAMAITLAPQFTGGNLQQAVANYCLSAAAGNVVLAHDPPTHNRDFYLLNGFMESISMESAYVDKIYMEYTLPKDFSKHVVEYRNVSPMELE
jgi:hypothetical protein